MPTFILGRKIISGDVPMFDEHLVRQEENLMPENAMLVFMRPEYPSHSDFGELTESEIRYPHIFAQIVADGIAEIFHHVEVGLLCGGLVEFSVFIEHIFC